MRPSQVLAIDNVNEYAVIDLIRTLGAMGLFFPPEWEEVA
jgi:hypothetical protein